MSLLRYSKRIFSSEGWINILFRIKSTLFNKNHIIVACFPKSASSYLTGMISKATNYKKSYWKQNAGMVQNFLYMPKINDDLSCNNVIQQHFKYNNVNRDILERLNLKVVVLTRNIYDIVISLVDHIDQNGKSPLEDDILYFFHKYTLTEKIDYVIDNIIPWYFSFYSSWKYAESTGKNEILFIDYNDLVDKPQIILNKIFLFYRLDIKYNVESIVQTKFNFNKGEKGRGKKQLTRDQICRIQNLSRFYKDIDFVDAGIL